MTAPVTRVEYVAVGQGDDRTLPCRSADCARLDATWLASNNNFRLPIDRIIERTITERVLAPEEGE